MTSPGLTTTIDDITGTCKNMGRGEPEGNITQNIGPDGPSSYLTAGFFRRVDANSTATGRMLNQFTKSNSRC